MHERTNGTTRRGVLTAAAGLLAAGSAGCMSKADANDATQDMSVAQHDTLPNYERNWSEDLEMGLSGAVLYTREGAEAHTLDVARLTPDGDWFLDVVDLCQYEHDGQPESDVRAEDLAEGGTVVLLAAHNDRGTIVSPDAEEHRELNRLLPD